ncbi:MAG TPA: YqiA/YcfP family alpha/beta fold hydrolase [Rhodocyclaceae bacterium]|nr:YqiA/YcfP family alpha/beta fold hydrolase [Rhodocyclaceae bacterium]
MIVYLHGFRSSPASQKAQMLARRMAERGLADRLWCEQLPFAPLQAIELAERAIAAAPSRPTLVGSSLGGYYATWLAEKHDLKAVLINPAVVASLPFADFVGSHTNLYTGERFEFTPEHVTELRRIEVGTISKPERFWLLVETADEVLDYRQAALKYVGARQTVIEGGDHSFRHFGEFLDGILDFAGLGAAAPV